MTVLLLNIIILFALLGMSGWLLYINYKLLEVTREIKVLTQDLKDLTETLVESFTISI